MLASAFISQIQQRFSHDKRARVCLWFDPSSEFSRLLPIFSQHLEEMKSSPFRLLAYDRPQKHGQLWLKRQVRLAVQDDPKARVAATFTRSWNALRDDKYWDTSFSYIDKESGQETFVSVPEMGGGSLINEGQLSPGSVYTTGTDISRHSLKSQSWNAPLCSAK